MRNKNIDKRIQEYLDHQFLDIKQTQQLFDMKEELFTNLKERVSEVIQRGHTEEEAFKEAVISMGDLSSLVEDMRLLGQDTAKQSIYSKEAERSSTRGIITGVLLFLFGIFASLIVYLMLESILPLIVTCLFTIPGVLLIVHNLLIRETRKRFAMNKNRAKRYTIAIGILLYGPVISLILSELLLIALIVFMMAFLIGVGILLSLMLTEKSRLKKYR